MKKVRVIKEMPFVKVGQCFDVTNTNFLASSDYNAEYLPVLYEGKHVDCFIAAGWLEEVKEPQNIVRVVQDAYKYQTEFGVVELGDELARKIATIYEVPKVWNLCPICGTKKPEESKDEQS